MTPTDEQIERAAEAIVSVAGVGREFVNSLEDVDRIGPKNVGCCPFDPRAMARAALESI